MNGYHQSHLAESGPDANPRRTGSPLRTKDVSPYRNTAAMVNYFHISILKRIKSPAREEEEAYERRRQEELRKQIAPSNALAPRRDFPNETRSLDLSSSNPQSVGSGFNLQSSSQIPERDRPSASYHFTLGPPQANHSSSNPSSYAPPQQEKYVPPPHLRDHINQKQSDNSSLMRRLNLVMQELDRVNREKEDIYARLKQSAMEASELQKILSSEDNVDKVNNYMREDIIFERDKNHKVKQQIKELDLYRGDLIAELRKLQIRQADLSKENQELAFDIDKKADVMATLDKEIYFTNEKIKQVGHSIENLKEELILEGHDKQELDRIISQLMRERNDLLNQLELLNRKYDECVRDISHDRHEMEKHNKKHAKLIAGKVMFLMLDQLYINRFAQSVKKMQEYCEFDKKTHTKLGQFAKVLEKAGHYRLKIALTQWYSNSIEPIKAKKHNKQLAFQRIKDHLRLKYFIIWKKTYDQKIREYELKDLALSRIWNIQVRDKQQEVKRAFAIWKDQTERFNLQKQRVKKLVWKLYFNKLNAAFNSWQNHTSNIEAQVRLQLLSKQFSQKQYLTILFNNFRLQITEKKRKRKNILFHCLKAWKYQLKYRKFIMATSIQAMHFRRNFDSWIMKQCFDAFRQNKEQEKLLRTQQVLFEQELPMIEGLMNQTDDIEVQSKFKAKQRACESVKKMMATSLQGYLIHWKNSVEDYKEKLRTTLKDKIIKVYMERIRQAFFYWKTLDSNNLLSSQSMIISEYQEEGRALQNEVIDLKNDLKNRQTQLDCSQQKHVHKCVLSYQKRMKELAMGRWRDRINEMNIKEDGASIIIKRMRLRFLRQAFDRYLAGVQDQKKTISDEDRCRQYNKTRNERLKKQVYNHWKLFISNHVRAKRYWYRMFTRLDLGMKSIALKKWRDWNQKKVERELITKQNDAVQNIDDLNHNIGQLHQDETSQQMNIKNLKGQMTMQARRIIANAFARYYYVSETRGFEKWKDFVEFEKRKERLMKKYLDHMRKSQFYMVKASLQNWIQNCKIQEKRDLLKKEEMKLRNAHFQLENSKRNFDGDNNALIDQIESEKEQQRKYNHKLQKSISMIIRKRDDNDHVCQKRYILQMWRQYVQREVNFIKCVEKVMSKSLWNFGLMKIRQFSRDENKENNLSTTLNRFRQKFWKRTCGNAFSIWRSGQYALATTTIEEIENETNKVISEHQDKKAVFKEVNKNRSERIIKKDILKNLFAGWRNITQLLKFHKTKDDDFKASADILQKKMVLRKWNQRKQATKVSRTRCKRLKEKVQQIRLRMYFFALRDQFKATKEFITRLSNFARIHDHHALEQGFNSIQTYARAKNYVYQTRKVHASQSIESILNNLIRKRKQQYLNDLRVKSLLAKRERLIKSFTILHNLGNRLRAHFLKWKEWSQEQTLAIEMQEEGPIREEVLEAKIQLKNLKSFMASEGYDAKDVQDALQIEQGRQKNLILRTVRKMQHYNEEGYLKPLVIDRWKQFVHLRRLFKYWLGFVDKRAEYVKSDLHQAFDTWKNHHPKEKENLQKLKKAELESRHLKNQDLLDKMAENIDDKENLVANMNIQREALLENLVKGQKLALVLWMNYRKRETHQALIKWFQIVKDMKNMKSLENLRANMELIERLKNKIASLEIDNENVANENEELRQFSIDGYELSKSVQALTNEREKLSVDLADKSQTIRKLLAENEKLNGNLRSAQKEAQSLIQSTMAGSTAFKTGHKGRLTGSNFF